MNEVRMDFQDILTENYHLFSKYLVADDFVDTLLSKNVLSHDDREIICNHYVNQTRRQKATKLIDVLMTKGPRGYDSFIEILEYQYPHVFKEVTKREPRPAPKGAPRNRFSDRLRLIENLPNLAHHIREQFKQNHELNTQLTVLGELLQISKKENKELEDENETMKNGVTEKNKEIVTLKTHMNQLQAEVNKLNGELKSEMERSHQIRDERDTYKQKLQDLLIEQQSNQATKIVPTRGPTDFGRDLKEKHIKEQIEILKEQLAEQTQQTEEYANKLTESQDRETELRKCQEKLRKELRKANKETEILERDMAQLEKKNNIYLEIIRQKCEDLVAIEDQKRHAEDRIREIGKEKDTLFEKVHRLEQELHQSQSELERLKLRLSRSSQEMSSSAEEGQEDVVRRRKNVKKMNWEAADSDSDADENMGTMFIEENLKSSTLPGKKAVNDSPEVMFQQEVAHFRYTLKEVRKRLVEETTSMEVNVPESMRRKPGFWNFQSDPEILMDIINFPADLVQHYSNPEKEPVVHPSDSDDIDDKESTVSSQLVPRNSNNRPDVVADAVIRRHETVRAICVSTDFSDFSSHDVYSVLLPRSCRVGNECNRLLLGNAPITRGLTCCKILARANPSGIQESLNCLTVSVKLPILNDKFEIKGGNHTGIFISKVNKQCGVTVEEQIKEIIYTPNENADPVVISLQGVSLEDVHKLFSEDYIRKKKEKEVKLTVRKSNLEYESALKWMVENGGTGDFFYIRCNFEKKDNTQQQDVKESTLRPGEIFLVRDTCCEEELWLGYKINEVTGDRAREESRIFTDTCARRKLLKTFHVKEDSGGKKKFGFKFKGQIYERVLPMKASVKLPVMLFGPEPLVEALMDLIANKLGASFTVQKPGKSADLESYELYRLDNHSVWKGKLDRVSSTQRHIQKIIFLLKITSVDAISALRCVFGSDFSMDIKDTTLNQCNSLQKTLVDKGFRIEELCFPELTFTESLLSKFKSCVRSSQDRILWLSHEEMDSSVAEKYLTYLGPDLSKVMTSVQVAQSMDCGTDS